MRYSTRDIALCNELSMDSSKALARAIEFVSLTIRTQFSRVARDRLYVDNGNPDGIIWGNKVQTFEFTASEPKMRELWTHARAIGEYRRQPSELLDLYLSVPGLGLAKAGFLASITHGLVGCIDSHNARMYGVGMRQLRGPGANATTKTRTAHCRAYVELCGSLGGADWLWFNWCEFMADKYPKHFDDGAHVSRLHYKLIALPHIDITEMECKP